MIGALDSAAVCIIDVFGRVRDVDHDAEPIHLGDDLFAERREPIPFPAVALAGVRIGELIVAVVGERQIARAAIVEFFDAGDVLAERIAVLDAHESDFFALCVDSPNVARRERQLDLVRSDFAGEALDSVELFNGEFVGALVASGFERIGILRFSRLADIND